jgi:glycosyltransferase involved in cell wall biosynthesis
VIWSLHDIHAATGGCIHPLECDHFATHCHDCPSLKQAGRHDRSWHEFRLKDRLYQRLNLHIVGNSEWTTAQARRSALMRHAKSVHTIPLGLSVDDFKPIDKSCARQVLGISSDRFVVGFACTDFSDPNKGGELLRKALCQLAEQTEIALLTYGGEFPSEGRGGYQILELGRLTSPLLQSLFYSACDVFALPSRTESFGLTALEAMACGTPVVGFRSGGPAEVIADGETGLLSKTVGKVDELYTNLRWLHQHPAERQRMGRKARDRVVHKFSSTLMAERYAELYRSLVGTSK